MEQHKVGQGKRHDLTSVNPNRSKRTRDVVGEMIGVSGVQVTKLLFTYCHVFCMYEWAFLCQD